jgi:transglutaminase-like putative cysteine protease
MKFPVALPEKMEVSEITLTVTSQENGVFNVRGERVGGMQFEAKYDPVKKVLSKFDLSGGYEARPKAEGPKLAALPEGYHPLNNSMLGDNAFMTKLRDMKKLTGNISFNIPEGSANKLYLIRFSQEFAGKVDATSVAGIFTSKKMGHKVTNTPNWPLNYPLSGVEEQYGMPERGIDSDDAAIGERAGKIVAPAETAWDAARAIGLWVYRNVQYAEVSGGASETFKSLKGDSRAKALLCAAMCRSVGIPARVVIGLLWADGPTDHTWVEVWLGEKAGWGPLDPTTNEADKIGASHISLWLGPELPSVLAKDVTIENAVAE